MGLSIGGVDIIGVRKAGVIKHSVYEVNHDVLFEKLGFNKDNVISVEYDGNLKALILKVRS